MHKVAIKQLATFGVLCCDARHNFHCSIRVFMGSVLLTILVSCIVGFSFLCLVPNIALVSGLSILHFLFGFLYFLLITNDFLNGLSFFFFSSLHVYNVDISKAVCCARLKINGIICRILYYSAKGK